GGGCHARSADRQRDGSKPNWDIHLNPDHARAACRSPGNADFLASGQGLRALDAQADLTELRGGRRLGKNEAMLVGEGLFDAPCRVGRRVLHPRPDEAVDATGWDPTLECGERRRMIGLLDVHHRGEERRAADLAANDHAVRGDLDTGERRVAKGSKVRSPLSSMFRALLDKTLTLDVLSARAVSNWDLTMFTAVSWKI